MADKLWFKAKQYGWGWYPSSWEGWVVTLFFALIIPISVVLFQKTLINSINVIFKTTMFILWMVIITTALMLICYRKGEKPRWRWG